MKYLLLSCSIFISAVAIAQNAQDTGKVFRYVQQMPAASFDMGSYLSKNIHYPDSARKHNIQGKVIVQFQINGDGSVSNCKVLKGIGGGCDEEALRVLGNMPRWKPGKQDGVPVKVLFNQPIAFSLQEDNKSEPVRK